MHKIIHETFELDLSNASIALNEDNSWFSDTFNTKYSFPFSLDLSDEISLIFEDLVDHLSEEIIVEYEVVYVFNDIMEKAILSIEGLIDSLSFQLKYGIENFPNFNKKLSELNFDTVYTQDIYAHAKTIITKTWPEVNYNFPQIHTDKIDTENSMWTFFEKIINNYKSGDFVKNTVVEDVPHNKNVMQPLLYFLYIMKQGFLDAGYTLKGDVLEIPSLKKKLLYINTDYHKILDQASIPTIVLGSDMILPAGNSATFREVITLPQAGRYQISGNINIYGRWKENTWARIKYRNRTIWSASKREKKHHSGYMYSYNIDLIFDTIKDSSPQELIFESDQHKNEDNAIADFYTTSLFYYNNLGVAIPNVIQNDDIEPKKLVPDITFGTLITCIKNWYNLDITVSGKDIFMDFIETKINYENAIDLTEYQTKPEIIYSKGLSFLLQFASAADEKNKHQEMFFTSDGFTSSGYVTDDKTSEITIQAFPLLNDFRNGVQTAYAIESEPNKIYAVLYDGLNEEDLNLTLDPALMLLPEVSQTYYRDWLDFRLNSINFKWNFNCFIEALNGVSTKNKIFSYGRYFIMKTFNKEQFRKNQFDVEIDAYTLK